MNTDPDRLKRLAELEDGSPIGVGGWMFRKVLFLDIDGVLNSEQVLHDRGRHDAIDRGMVEQINRVVDATGCSIVISSTWRLLYKLPVLSSTLRLHGLRANVIGATPLLERRDEEISAWLADHPQVEQFAIVDDSPSDISRLEDRLVVTSWMTGILPEHADALIKLLS